MSFHMPDSYYEPPDDFSCARCEDDDSLTHDDCLYTEADAYEDAIIARAEWAREDADIRRGEEAKEDRA